LRGLNRGKKINFNSKIIKHSSNFVAKLKITNLASLKGGISNS